MKTFIRTLLLATAFSAGAVMAGPVNINTADAATIAAELNGVGMARAEAIVAYRDANGPFSNLDELKLVKGIGDAIIEKNRDSILFKD